MLEMYLLGTANYEVLLPMMHIVPVLRAEHFCIDLRLSCGVIQMNFANTFNEKLHIP
jgi:hypothetical protein